ncbi:MAG: LacI family DNA-binding transcriptional regulator [Candidatus Sumerlaeota bacterium]|nr:LacI family DNA-binding transcriptional regulator [Candidatus Sumerlaeota bacterium]
MSETRRRTNLSDIAAAAGVDASTVSLALNSSPRIAGKTREKILRIARKLNYSPNFLARGLTGQKTRSVGLLVSTFQDQFYVELVAALERWLRQRGYSCLLSTVATEEGQNEIQAIRDLFNRFVDGVACAGIGNQNAMQEELAALAGQGMPLVGFGELLDAPALRSAPMDRVTCPLGQSCAEMTRHLLDLGHRRIAFVGMGPHKISGYSEALRERGIPLDPSLVVSLAYHFQDVNELRKEMMSRRDRPTAIFAYTDDLAAELVMELQEAGYRTMGWDNGPGGAAAVRRRNSSA